MNRSSLAAALMSLATACAAASPADPRPALAPPAPTPAAERSPEPSASAAPVQPSLPNDGGGGRLFFDIAPARRDAFERSVATAAAKFAHGEIEAGLQVLEAATTDLPVPPLPSKQYPPCAEHDIALVRELTGALREALQRGGGGAPMMDAIGRIFVDELEHPLEAPLHDYAMRILEQEIKTAPDVVACESAVRWLEGHARRGSRVPPLAADLHRRFRHRLVCHQPCDAPRPSC